MVQFIKTVIFSAKSKRRGVSAKEFTYEVAANKIFLHRVQVRAVSPKPPKSCLSVSPTISFCIKELEDEFGLKLFQRKHGRMVLTVEGQFFLKKSQIYLQATDVLEKQMRDMATNRSHVKIAVPAMISTFLFPEMFHAFEEKYPDVQLEMLETGSLQTRKLIDANAVDLASPFATMR